MPESIDYLNPKLPAALDCVEMPILEATDAALKGYGRLIEDPNDCRIEIVRWPKRYERPAGPSAIAWRRAVHFVTMRSIEAARFSTTRWQ